jgi:hypothetical protein
MQHVAIAKTNHSEPLLSEPFGPCLIVSLLLDVCVAVDLYNKMAGRTAEIDHKWADRHLPAELEPGELPIAQVCPEPALERGLLAAQFPGMGKGAWVDSVGLLCHVVVLQ